MAKLFVSYSRKDSVAARKLIEALKSIQQDVWVDWEDIPPAVDWLEQILRGIEGSDAFIFLISPDSVASEVCNVEVKHAARNNKRIVPVVLRDVDPKITIEAIRKLNWTFMREQDSFEEGLTKVKVAIELDLPWVEEHNRLQARALDWHRKKESSLLLRGRDLRNAKNMIDVATSKDPSPTDLQRAYIQHSLRDERRRVNLWIATAVTVVVMAVLSLFALIQRGYAIRNADEARRNAQEARENEIAANENRLKAEENEALARENEKKAIEARQAAEDAEKLAEAQRSAARAQIYQTRPGELDTSTLLAIDSLKSIPSDEAEEILRKNISLLPLPVAQASQAGNINSLEYSPDGSAFLTASADGTVCLWNAGDGKRLFCATSPGPVNDAAFSPNGQFIVTGDESGLVQILSAENGKVENEYKFGVPVRDVSVRWDGGLLAVARNDGKISIINLKTRKESYQLQTYGSLSVSAFSPNGLWLAAGSNSGSVTIWNLADGKVISGPRHKDGVLTIAFSPNSNYIVSGGKDSAAHVAETRTGKALLRIANENWVRDIAFSPDGLWFVTASDDKRVRVWSTDSGRERLRLLQDGVVTDVKVSTNGQWIATTSLDKTVRVWNSATGTEIFQIPLKAGGSVLAFNKEGNTVVAGDQSGAINVWDISSMAAPVKYAQFIGTAGDLQFSPSGDWLAASDENRVWLLRPEPLANLPARLEGTPTLQFKSRVEKVVFSPDSRLLGIATEGSETAVYQIETRSLKRINDPAAVQALAFSADSLQLITTGSDGQVRAWDTSSGDFIDGNSGGTLLAIESIGAHSLLAASADGSLLASSNSSGQIEIWKYQNAQFIPQASLQKDQAVSMSFDPAGELLAVGTNGNVHLIDTTTGKELARIPHVGVVSGVSFSADGSILATASSRTMQFWEVAGIQLIKADDLIETACSRLTENFSQERWSALFGSQPYELLCTDLPVP